mmetsp:Transcript_10552/g.21378  ORF Transcript_10552/g.21378 Transcript_10552/m.21378 type:complete len:213 (-) Transcript_10552:98-736(-)
MAIFSRLKLSALRYFDLVLRPVVDAHRARLNLPDDQHRLLVHHLPKHHVLPVQPVRLPASDEELAPVAVRPGVGHAEDSRPLVLARKVLVVERHPVVDRRLPRPIPVYEVPTLDHETLDDAVEEAALVAHGLSVRRVLAGAELTKVFAGLGDERRVQLNLNAAQGHSSNCHVEEDASVATLKDFSHVRVWPLGCHRPLRVNVGYDGRPGRML